MTPRENFIHFFKNEPYDWIPTSLDELDFYPSLLCENIGRGVVLEQEPYTGPYGGKDFFGGNWIYEEDVGGSIETGTILDDITEWKEKLVFPDLSALDWVGCARANSEYLKTDKIIHTMLYTGFFERLISFVGFEEASMAMVLEDEREVVKELFDRLADLYIEEIRYLHRYCHVELFQLHDDWGSQRSPLFSVETHREMICPYVKKVVDAAHKEGVFVEMHSCGLIDLLIPNLIDTGVDTWRGQDLGNKPRLVEQYGDRFKFAVWVCTAPTDAESSVILAQVKEVIHQYAGKRVWLCLIPDDFEDYSQTLQEEIRKLCMLR